MNYSVQDKILLKSNFERIESSSLDPEALMAVLRTCFTHTFYMECADLYEEGEKSIMIAAEPMAGMEVWNTRSGYTFKKEENTAFSFDQPEDLRGFMDEWIEETQPAGYKECVYNGLLGYASYNSVQLSENIRLSKYTVSDEIEIPLIKFNLYRYLFVFRKSAGEILLINNCLKEDKSELDIMKKWLEEKPKEKANTFSVLPEVTSDCTDDEFITKIQKAKNHCMLGDVFQVVLSRKFCRAYLGDPWVFFKQLKQKDISSFQFFMDEGDFQITGTSPEIHFHALKRQGSIHPIAGTYKRSVSEEEEKKSEIQLLNDSKENSEHVMLVDLARNDLNKIAKQVHVSQFRKIVKYSHVMHLVSEVKGTLPPAYAPFRSIMDVFPAGTLSGAPKYRAMQIIDDLENSSRSFYGGLLGWIGFNKDINTCIIIRSALFKNQKMIYRAGAGVVQSSVPELELEEVNNKLQSISTTLLKFEI
jgi:anthranilate synthase component I